MGVSPQRVCYRKMVLNFDVSFVIQLYANCWHFSFVTSSVSQALVPCDVRAKGVSCITTVNEGRHTIHVKMFQRRGFLRASDVEYIQKDERVQKKGDKKVNTFAEIHTNKQTI